MNKCANIHHLLNQMIFLMSFMLLCPFVAADDKGGEKVVFSTMGNGVEFPTKSLAVKVVQEAYRRIGITVHVNEYPALRALHISNSGAVDGELFRGEGVQERFTNLVPISVPLFENEWVAFSRDQSIQLKGCQDLRTYKVAIERGVPPAENCTKGMKVFALTNEVQMFKMVNVGRADIAVDALLDGKAVMSANNIQGVKALMPPLFRAKIYHYLHDKNKHLIPQVTDAIQEVLDEGLLLQYEKEILEEVRFKKRELPLVID